MMNFKEYQVSDLSGGITDYYLRCNPNQYKAANNLIITINSTLQQRPGSVLLDAAYARPEANRVGQIVIFDTNSIMAQIAKNIYLYSASGWSEIVGSDGSTDHAFTAGTIANYASFAEWNKHLFFANDAYSSIGKIIKNSLSGSDVWMVLNAGLPKTNTTTLSFTPPAGTDSYVYYFVYYYQYKIGDITYEDYSSTSYKAVTSGTIDAGHANALTGICSIASGFENYDTANIKVKIYRTLINQTSPFYLATINNGVTTYSDVTPDATLQLSSPLYTLGGVYDNDPPPKSKFLTMANNILWYANQEATPRRVRQSIQFDLDSCPESFYIEIDQDITALSSINEVPIVFSKNKIYRIEGFLDETGNGVLSKRCISSSIGCISNLSVVKTINGLYFAASDGFYFTDGYNIKRLTDQIPITYLSLVDTASKQLKIQGTRDEKNQLVWWTVCSDDTENNKVFVYHEIQGSFTTLDNRDSAGTYMVPTAVCYYEGDIIRGDHLGYVYLHSENVSNDKWYSNAISSWIDKTIRYDFISEAINFGSEVHKKWVPNCTINCRNLSKVSIQPRSINDDTLSATDMAEIRFRNSVNWGDPDIIWNFGEWQDLVWNYRGLVIGKRRFPKNKLRCTYKQLELTNSYTVITTSDEFCTARLDPNGTVTLDDTVNYSWIDKCEGYFISFEFDNYTAQYEIKSRSAATLSLVQTSTPTATAQKWEIKGYRKDEFFELLSYTISYDFLGNTQQVPSANNSGELN